MSIGLLSGSPYDRVDLMLGRISLCALALMATACQIQQQSSTNSDDSKEEVKPAPIYIGTIHQVYPEHNFALVRLARMVPKPGTVLISHPPDGNTGRLANLCVSAEQIKDSVSRMVAADIRGGTAVQGDAVYIYKNLSPKPAKKQDVAITDEEGNEFLPPVDGIFPAEEAQANNPFIEDLGSTPDYGNVASPLAPPNKQAPTLPAPAPTPHDSTNPSYIDNIPDTLDAWD